MGIPRVCNLAILWHLAQVILTLPDGGIDPRPHGTTITSYNLAPISGPLPFSVLGVLTAVAGCLTMTLTVCVVVYCISDGRCLSKIGKVAAGASFMCSRQTCDTTLSIGANSLLLRSNREHCCDHPESPLLRTTRIHVADERQHFWT
jgi:hypothetical protein